MTMLWTIQRRDASIHVEDPRRVTEREKGANRHGRLSRSEQSACHQVYCLIIQLADALVKQARSTDRYMIRI
jgi:hypothetical protein